MNNEKTLSQEESLRLITSMIRNAKDDYRDTGATAILWGATIAICALLKLSELLFHYALPFDVFLLTIVSGIINAVLVYRNKTEKKVEHYEESFTKYIWAGFIISLVILILFINVLFAQWIPSYTAYKQLTGEAPSFQLIEFVTPLFLLIYGIPTFITGAACKFKPMLIGGIICWAACVASIFTSLKIDYLLMALAVIFAWLIPGILMDKEYRQYKKQKQQEANV